MPYSLRALTLIGDMKTEVIRLKTVGSLVRYCI